MRDTKYHIESCADTSGIIQLLEDKIYDFNAARTGKADGHLFSTVLRNDKDEIIAGIGGWTWADACEVTQLWVDEKMRGKGIGKMLLTIAEKEAKDKGCFTILIKTYSFQAPEFYIKHGFVIGHIINDFPRGYQYYTLIKKIA